MQENQILMRTAFFTQNLKMSSVLLSTFLNMWCHLTLLRCHKILVVQVLWGLFRPQMTQ